MRNFVNRFGLRIIVSCLVVALLVVWWSRRTGAAAVAPQPKAAYFVDEATGEASVQPIDALPPLAGKDSKRTVVEAAKFQGKNDPAPRCYYYLKYSDAALEQVQGMQDDLQRQNILFQGQLVRSAEAGSEWLSVHSPEAEKILEAPQRDAGGPRKEVFPSSR